MWGHFLLNGPELKPWHLAILDEEFTAQAYSSGAVTNLAQYRELETRLTDEVQRKVYAKTGAADRLPYNRYNAGSRSDPGTWPQDWNHTFILEPPGEPVGGVLLLHGLTDSPYSMRSIGLMLADQGFKVVGLRLPGHGTVPAGLTQVELEDLEAATQMAMRDLRKLAGAHKPLYAMGYSNGAALAVNYSLDALADPALPHARGTGADLARHRYYETRGDRPHASRDLGHTRLGSGGMAGHRSRDRSLQIHVLLVSRRRHHATADQAHQQSDRKAGATATVAGPAANPGFCLDGRLDGPHASGRRLTARQARPTGS